MPPLLALILCLIFVAVLLWLDRLQHPEASKILWLPTIWLLYVAGKPLASWFGVGGESMEAGSPWDRNFQIVLILWAAGLLLTSRPHWRELLFRQPVVLALLGYWFVSVLWSDIPFISFKRWIREWLAIMMILLVATEQDPRKAVVTLVRRATYIMIPVSMLLIKYYPLLGAQYGRWSGKLMWIGVALQKNGLGLICLIGSFFLIHTLAHRLRNHEPPAWRFQTHLEILVLGLALWMLKGPPNAYSATSIAVLVFGLVLGYILYKGRQTVSGFGGYLGVSLVVGFLAIGTTLPFIGATPLASFSQALGRDATLTGRTEIWEGLVPEVMQHPILGWGFGGFWTTQKAELHLENTAHNGYLETTLDSGFAGLFLISAFVITSAIKARRGLALDYQYASFWLCCVAMTALHNISESSIDSFTRFLAAVLLLFLFGASGEAPAEEETSEADSYSATGS